MSLGGYVAERVVFGDVTTGASNDLEKATEIARAMVTRYGMSDLFPHRTFGKQEEIFLGRDYAQNKDHGPETAQEIDDAVNGLLDASYEHARQILETHREELEAMAAALEERETLHREDVEIIFAGVEKWTYADGELSPPSAESHS